MIRVSIIHFFFLIKKIEYNCGANLEASYQFWHNETISGSSWLLVSGYSSREIQWLKKEIGNKRRQLGQLDFDQWRTNDGWGL